MQENYAVAGKSLQIMFWGSVVTVVGYLTPLVGGIVVTVGTLVMLYGLFTARNTHENYKMALYMIALEVGLNVLGLFFPRGIGRVVIVVLHAVVSFLDVY